MTDKYSMPGTWGPMGPSLGAFSTPFGAFHCPVCGYSGPAWHPGVSPSLGFGAGFMPSYYTMAGGWGLGGLRRWGGTYSPQYVATGLPTDEEITEMLYDAIDTDPLIPYDADINIEVDAGAVTLTGKVPNRDIKHAAGDDAWWVPGVTDVRNNLTVTGRRRVKAAPARREQAPATRMGPSAMPLGAVKR